MQAADGSGPRVTARGPAGSATPNQRHSGSQLYRSGQSWCARNVSLHKRCTRACCTGSSAACHPISHPPGQSLFHAAGQSTSAKLPGLKHSDTEESALGALQQASQRRRHVARKGFASTGGQRKHARASASVQHCPRWQAQLASAHSASLTHPCRQCAAACRRRRPPPAQCLLRWCCRCSGCC